VKHPDRHVGRAEAIDRALAVLRAAYGAELRDADAGALVICEELAEEHGIAWVIPFNSRRFLEAGESDYEMIPNLLVVPKDASPAHFAPSAEPLEEYLAAVAAGLRPWSGSGE
jgi:hypothetical protein